MSHSGNRSTAPSPSLHPILKCKLLCQDNAPGMASSLIKALKVVPLLHSEQLVNEVLCSSARRLARALLMCLRTHAHLRRAHNTGNYRLSSKPSLHPICGGCVLGQRRHQRVRAVTVSCIRIALLHGFAVVQVHPNAVV